MTQAIRRTLGRLPFAALGFVAGTVLVGVVVASPPDPNPGTPLPVREQNLDANGWIKVHEQGTANITGTVEVGNFPQTINIGNFPAVQDVNVTGGLVNAEVAPATIAFWHDVCADPSQVLTVNLSNAINATDLTLASAAEFGIYFQSPITTSGGGLAGIGHSVFAQENFDGDELSVHHAFTRPVPINAVVLHCTNESIVCCVLVDIVGTTGS